jgi:hypothetical protein
MLIEKSRLLDRLSFRVGLIIALFRQKRTRTGEQGGE